MNARGLVKWRRVRALLLSGLIATLSACADDNQAVSVGLMTKQEVNPYWMTMREVAEDTAEQLDVTLLTATGTSDVDVESQRSAREKMIVDGAKGILIAPTDSSALLPDIKAAREGEARHRGFLDGFGITKEDPAVIAMVDTEGDRKLGKARMVDILAKQPNVNIIYTVNEPAALGALEALKDADTDLDTTILVSIDGGCRAIKGAVRSGDIDATVMQFPQNMAREGVRALVTALRGGDKPTGFFDTGMKLITGDKPPGVAAEDVAYGVRNCWGE